MSELVSRRHVRSWPPVGGMVWFTWMIGMWLAFFWLLFANGLDEVWRAITQLPILVEIVVWIVFFPWLLGTWVWTGPWPDWLRVAVVLCFAMGWTVVSIPRRRKNARP
jgi:hypothetical protein